MTMILSPSEFFILGRIAARRPLFERASALGHVKASLLWAIDRVFEEFGLQRVMPPERWWDRTEDTPANVAWRESSGSERRIESIPTGSGVPGLPSVAVGLSPTEKGVMFVERRDGRMCGWKIEPPKSGLYLMLLRWLRPFVGPSPQLWVMLHEASWPAVVEEWRSLSDVKVLAPNWPFMPEPPGNFLGFLETAVSEAGGMDSYRLGKATGTVDYALAEHVGSAGFRPTNLLRVARCYRRKPDDFIYGAFEEAKSMLTSAAAIEVMRADLHVAELYAMAKKELFDWDCEDYDSDLDMEVLMFSLAHANEWTHRASSCLYGMLRASGGRVIR